jgi:fibronectin-binding autotransporter adhesin
MGQTLYTFNGGGTTGNWSSASTWTTDPTGSTALNQRVPASGDNVVVTNSYVVMVTAAVPATGLNLTIQRGGVLDLTSSAATISSLSSLSGQGTLRIGAPQFPTFGTNGVNNFDDPNTGTVEFYNWPAGPTVLPQPVSGLYNNLRLLNTTSAAYTVQMDNNLTVNGNLTLTRTVVLAGTPQPSAVILNFGAATSAARTLNVLGDLTVGAGTTLGVSSVNLPVTNSVQTAHALNVAGSFVNNGTVRLHNGTDAQAALLTFTGGSNANFTCNNTTYLGRMQVNKGTDSQVLLNVTASVFPGSTTSSYLTLNYLGNGRLLNLVNGVTKFGSNIYLNKIHNGSTEADPASSASSGWYELGSTSTSPTLWVAAGATVINSNAASFIVYGTFRISTGGTFVSLTPDAMVLREDGQVLIEGGTTTVNKFRPSSTAPYHRGSFVMTGGTFESLGTIPRSSPTLNDGYARFAMPFLSQYFRMSGGTLRVLNPSPEGLFHVGVDPNNAIISGGTVELTIPNSTVVADILTSAPLWNLTIKRAGTSSTSKAILADIVTPAAAVSATTTAQPLTVLNNFTLDATNSPTFDANSKDVNIQGTFTLGSGSTYLTGTNTTTFSGGQDQTLVNNGTIGTTSGQSRFSNWTINKSAGTLTLGGSVTTYTMPAGTTLALLKGVLNDNDKTINVLGSIYNSASHTSGGVGNGGITMAGTALQTIDGDDNGVFGNLNINNGTTPVAVQLTANISVANQLTFFKDGVFAIGTNRLSITNVSSSAVQTFSGTGFSNKCMIQTAGNQSDLGLQKTFAANNSNFLFPVGVNSKYMPASIQLSLADVNFKYGQVSVSPTGSRNPFAGSSSLNYYWKVRSVGFGPIPANSITLSFTMTNADITPTGSYSSYIPARYTPTAWATSVSNRIQGASTNPTANIQFQNASQFEGEYTAGLSTAFNTIVSYYSAVNGGDWETPGTWRTGSLTGPAATAKPAANNPVFIGSNHTINVKSPSATSGSLVLDAGSTLDLGVTTGHNFGALPDSKVGGSGTLRITAAPARVGTSTPAVYAATPVFPGGDFGSFIQAGGGTVEYYGIANGVNAAAAYTMTVPTASSTLLTLNSYENLTLNPYPNSTLTLPNLTLRVYSNLLVGTSGTYTGTASISGTTSGNLQVGGLNVQNGKLRFANGTVRTLAVDGDVQVGTNGSFDTSGPGARVANTVTVGGSVVNNGTLDFNTTGPKTAALTFTSATNTALTSAGSLTNLLSLNVNKGTGRAAQLRLDGTGTLNTPANGWLTLTNGTLYYAKPGATLTIHDAATTPYLITDNAGLTVDAPNGTVTIATNSTAADLKLAGQLQVAQGTLRVGNNTTANTNANTGNDIEYASAGAPGITVTGGNLYVNGQVRRPVTNLDGALRFDQSGGTIDIDGQGASAAQSNERGLLEVQGKNSIFRMGGGSLNLHRSNQKNPILTADLYLAPDSTVVTGGTVMLGNTTSINSNVTISVNSTVPLFDLQVAAGNTGSTNTGQLTGVIPLTLKGSLTIGNDFSFFKANGLGLNINQNLVNNNPSTSTLLTVGGFQPGTTTQTTTFVGGVATQQLTGTGANLTTFGSLVLNTPQPNGTLQLLNNNALVAGTLTLTKGTLDDNGRTITALGDVLNSAVHTSGGTGNGQLILGGTTNQNVGGNDKGVFGNVTLSNSAGATATANQQITKVLNLSSGIFTIGSNLLWLSNPAAGAITNYGDTRFIRTNGIVADLGLRKSYPSGALDFTFPVGAAAKYTPVRMYVTTNPTAGTLTVQPIDLAHPSTTGSGTNKISFYWKVSSTLNSPTVDQYFTYGLNDIAGTESTYKLGRFYNGAWTPLGGIPGSAVTGTRTLTKLGYNDAVNNTIDGDYTGGDADEFKAVPTFYSRNSTAGQGGAVWTSASAWTFNPDGSDPAPGFNASPTLANPVVIANGHLITSNGPGLGAANLLLNGTLNLGSFGANNFNTVRGTGTVRIGSALFPAGNYAAFMTPATGGTVDYTGAVQLPARDTYNNLTFSGGNSKQLSNLDLTINGSLTLAAGTTVDNPTSQNITLTSATSGATLNGTFNLNDGNLTTSAFLANGGTLNLGAGLASIGTTFTNTGTLNNGTGDVVVGTDFNNAGTYNARKGAGNLTVGTTFTNSQTYNAGVGMLTVNGGFTNAAAGTFTTGSGSIMANGSFLNAGTYQQGTANVLRIAGNFTNSGYFSNEGSTLALYGNFTNSAGLNFAPTTSGLVQFITDANRILTGSTSFFDVQKVGNGNLLFSPGTTMTVDNLLTLRGGLIVTGTSTGNGTNTDVSNTLTLTKSTIQPIVGASTSSYVAGRILMALPDAATVSRVFPVGLGGRYRPVLVTPQATSSNAQVLVEIFNSAPASKLEASLSNISANRYYRIQLQSGTLNQPTVQLNFNTDVVDEEVHVPGNLRVATATSQAGIWSSAGGAGVFSPADPRGYTNSAATTIDATSFFALASTNKVDNPLTGSAPLPVQLLSFTATRQGTTVRAAWATASEKNSAYFVVQRSADGRTFSDVQRVAAQGNTLVRHDYAATDAQPLPGTSYYRLRQVDLDGTVAYSPVATVRFSDEQAAPSLAVYPNPTAGQRFQVLATGLGATGGTVQLFDNVGRLVLTQTAPVGAAEATIQPTRPLASGMYLVTWQTADGRKLTTKLAVD